MPFSEVFFSPLRSRDTINRISTPRFIKKYETRPSLQELIIKFIITPIFGIIDDVIFYSLVFGIISY